MTLAEFNRRFRIVPTSLFGLPRDLSRSDKPEGDCQDYARTVRKIMGATIFNAAVWRCWSPQNWKPPFAPRHAVMFIWGKGFIDSSRREYRWTPWPHIPAWPVGTPALVGLAVAARVWGWSG